MCRNQKSDTTSIEWLNITIFAFLTAQNCSEFVSFARAALCGLYSTCYVRAGESVQHNKTKK